MGPGRRFYDVVVVKGTFDMVPGELTLAERQEPVALADEVWDRANAERSSLKRAGDAVLVKPTTDVLVTGTVRSPQGRPMKEWDTVVGVFDSARRVICQSDAQVTGPRAWVHRRNMGWTLTEPEVTAEVPIRYELAYGGAYLDPEHRPVADEVHRFRTYAPNPSGLGFVNETALSRDAAYPAPQWQRSNQPISTFVRDYPLVGFAPIARPWSSRYQYAGTYDAEWKRQALADAEKGLCIDYARDFKVRFFQAAHPQLITASHLRGGEQLVLSGMVSGHDTFVSRFPIEAVVARGIDKKLRDRVFRLPLDTVHVDLEAKRVQLVWRLTLDQAWGLRSIVLSKENFDV